MGPKVDLVIILRYTFTDYMCSEMPYISPRVGVRRDIFRHAGREEQGAAAQQPLFSKCELCYAIPRVVAP